MNQISNALIVWNNYLESITEPHHSDIYDYCYQNTDTMIQVLESFGSDRLPSLDIGAGWIPLIVPLHHKILSLVNQYEIYQIKEKFGGLRFYADPIVFDAYSPENKFHINKIFQHLIQVAEEQSLLTCELCSAPAKVSTYNFRYRTICESCVGTHNSSFSNS